MAETRNNETTRFSGEFMVQDSDHMSGIPDKAEKASRGARQVEQGSDQATERQQGDDHGSGRQHGGRRQNH